MINTIFDDPSSEELYGFYIRMSIFGTLWSVCFCTFCFCYFKNLLNEYRINKYERIKQISGIVILEDKCDGTCSICLEDYESGEKIKFLRCGHRYHLGCINQWLSSPHKKCPECRASVGEVVINV